MILTFLRFVSKFAIRYGFKTLHLYAFKATMKHTAQTHGPQSDSAW